MFLPYLFSIKDELISISSGAETVFLSNSSRMGCGISCLFYSLHCGVDWPLYILILLSLIYNLYAWASFNKIFITYQKKIKYELICVGVGFQKRQKSQALPASTWAWDWGLRLTIKAWYAGLGLGWLNFGNYI